MKINCPACGKEIPAADVDLLGKVAKCTACNNIFSCAQQLPADASRVEERVPVGKPRNFEIERSAEGLKITRKWFTPGIIFMTFFCLFWNGFMFFWFYTAFKQKIYPMALFGTLHGAVGLGLLYGVLAGYLNKTYILIANNALTVRHRPLPWFGEKSLVKQDLKQLYSKKVVHSGRNGPSCTYSVQAVTRKGQVIELVSGLLSSEEALFTEQEIEKYLRIEDEPVKGEIA